MTSPSPHPPPLPPSVPLSLPLCLVPHPCPSLLPPHLFWLVAGGRRVQVAQALKEEEAKLLMAEEHVLLQRRQEASRQLSRTLVRGGGLAY